MMGKVVELRCPACQSMLVGLNTDRVFGCVPCGVMVDVQDGKLVRIELVVAHKEKAVPDEATVFYLPFWCFGVAISVYDSGGKEVTHQSRAGAIDTVYVSGFFEFHPEHLGNPGYEMTRLGVSFTPATHALPQLPVGIGRSRTDAARYPQIFVSMILDREHDITGMTINVDITRTALVAVPFYREPHAGHVVNLVSGERYPEQVVEELATILAYWGG